MATPQLNITARSILFLMPIGSKPPYQARLGLQTNKGGVKAMGDFIITDCLSVADVVKKAKVIIADLNLDFAEDFTLVFPFFTGKNSSEEAELINTAWEIKEAADTGGWIFSRIIPMPIF